jgi:hypothetical protein
MTNIGRYPLCLTPIPRRGGRQHGRQLPVNSSLGEMARFASRPKTRRSLTATVLPTNVSRLLCRLTEAGCSLRFRSSSRKQSRKASKPGLHANLSFDRVPRDGQRVQFSHLFRLVPLNWQCNMLRGDGVTGATPLPRASAKSCSASHNRLQRPAGRSDAGRRQRKADKALGPENSLSRLRRCPGAGPAGGLPR